MERTINGLPVEQRRAVRQAQVASLVDNLQGWMRDVRSRMSRHADVAKAIDYMLKRWAAFSRFLDDGRICLTNNAAERALRGVALGRKAWLFAGSDRGGERAAAMYSLIVTATTSIRVPGWPRCSTGSTTIPHRVWPSCCPGIAGRQHRRLSPPDHTPRGHLTLRSPPW